MEWLEFQKVQLDWFRDELKKSIYDQLQKRRIGVTEDLKKSVETFSNDASAGMNMQAIGRLVDMGAGRGYKTAGMGKAELRERRQANAGKKIRKPKPFYNRTVWGLSSRLITKLTHEFVEQSTTELKKTLTK